MKENMKENTRETTNGLQWTPTSLEGNIIQVLKKVSDEYKPYEQRKITSADFECRIYRFITGYSEEERVWFELGLVYVNELDEHLYQEILRIIHNAKIFRYDYYDKFYGRIVFFIPKKVKGIFPPLLLTEKTSVSPFARYKGARYLYVVLNPKVGKEKSIASAYAYLVNYFAKRAVRFEASVTGSSCSNINVWRRVKKIFKGKVNGREVSLSRSLLGLYNNIYYRVELMEEQRQLSEPVVKTAKLLADLFFNFAKLFDVFAKTIYNRVVASEIYHIIKTRVGFRSVKEIAKNVIVIFEEMKEWLFELEAEKILS